MTIDRYEREMKARNCLAMFSCGKAPHDRVWLPYDKAYATASGIAEEDAILNRFRHDLTARLILEQ